MAKPNMTLGQNLHFCFSSVIMKRPQPSSSNKITPPQPQLLHNYNSLYEHSAADSTTTSEAEEYTPDLASIYASRRFFISSPGRSNSIVDSVAGGVPVQTYSPDPYVDFRRSMQEMVEARELEVEGKETWDYLQELLLSYLSLNPKNTHKYIVGAFADLVLSLLMSSSAAPNHFISNC